MKFYQSGRSMVEMLGVLAIIGVLSVGAIAGYSKAMMKYKLNKSVENISYLMNIAYIYMYDIKPSGGNSTKDRSLIPYFIKMNLVPENMIKQGENSYIYDSFGNQISIFNNEPWNEMGFSVYTNKADSGSTQLCAQLLDMARMYYSYIIYIFLNTGNGSKFYSGALNSSYPDLQKINSLQECADGSFHVTIMFRNSK